MSASLGLLRLQQVDSRITQVEAKLAQIHATLENDARLIAARENLAHAEQLQAEAERGRRSAELQEQSQRGKIQQAESSLYGGSVRNPKELQDLQADVASLKKHLASIEDQELESMAQFESAEAELHAARAEYEMVSATTRADHEILVAEQSGLERDLEGLRSERSAAVSAVPPSLLGRYELLRQSRRGVAVAEVFENACAACGTILTAALQQSARHAAELVYCPSCGRILYAG